MSAAQLASIGLIAAQPVLNNAEFFVRKGREKIETVRRRSTVARVYEDDKSRSRPRGGFIGGAYDHRSKSVGAYSDYSSDDDDYYSRKGRRHDRRRRRRDARDYDSAYESEGPVQPRNRGAVAARNGEVMPYPNYSYRGTTNGTRSENDRDAKYDSSSLSDSTVELDSEEDERQEKKKRKQELLTGGMAAVATLHAAGMVYNSMKAREERLKQLAEGKITREDAKRQRYKHHLQDAASIGLAALSIKGAYGKWQGTVNKHREFKGHRDERRERQMKRIRKGRSRWNKFDSDDDEGYDPPRNSRGTSQPQLAYANADSRPQRPAYNRAYSRSLNDIPKNYRYPEYSQSYGRDERGYYDGRGYAYDTGHGGVPPSDLARYDTTHA